MRSLMIYFLAQYCAGDKIKNEMAGHVELMGRREACIGFWLGNLRERDHSGDPGVGDRIILRWIFSK
jgi:hypothetical protein